MFQTAKAPSHCSVELQQILKIGCTPLSCCLAQVTAASKTTKYLLKCLSSQSKCKNLNIIRQHGRPLEVANEAVATLWIRGLIVHCTTADSSSRLTSTLLVLRLNYLFIPHTTSINFCSFYRRTNNNLQQLSAKTKGSSD